MEDKKYCITVDVEWAHPDVLADLVEALDERSLQATFFCTHADVDVGGHERALHPNFRLTGDDALEALAELDDATSDELYRGVLERHCPCVPEAVGVRTHSLIFDSMLVPEFIKRGIRYDSSTYLPLQAGIRPHMREHGLCELPIYYMDHLDLIGQQTGWSLEALRLDDPGLKVLDFHPNIVFINAAQEDDYLLTKGFYHNPERLLSARRNGPGARTLWLDLLDALADRREAVVTCAEVASALFQHHQS